MTTLYRFELECGTCGLLWVEKLRESLDTYEYGSQIDYLPKGFVYNSPQGYIKSASGEPDAAALAADIRQNYTMTEYGRAVKELAEPSLGNQTCHKRIWRPGLSTPDLDGEGYTDATTAFISLQADLLDLLRVIEPCTQNSTTYGHATRELLLLACTEVETIWRSILVCNNYKTTSRLSTNDYVKVLSPLQLDRWAVKLVRYPDFPTLTPFKGWDQARPTSSISWYDAYNHTKHDRIANFDQATFGAVLNAMAALFVLLAAQYGIAVPNDHFQEPAYDELRVFRLESWPKFPLREQYAFRGNSPRKYVDFLF